MGMASIIVETYSQEYNTYFRVIKRYPDAPARKCSRGQAIFIVGFPRVGTMGLASIIVETYFREYDTYSRATRRRPSAPDRKCS